MAPPKSMLARSTLAKYARTMRTSHKELLCNRHLILTAATYAMSGVPLTWDQGSASVVPSLPGFQNTFGITSGDNAGQISNFVSIVYVGCGIGAAMSFFINDRIGRLWSFRLYSLVWVVGQMIATGSSGSLAALYVARIVSGLGIGALTVTGPLTLVEIAPAEFRGLIAVWFSVAMLLSLFVAVFCVYGVYLQLAASPLQYQTVWFSPCIFMALVCAFSFTGYCLESPRWLFLVDQTEKAKRTLIVIRGLGPNHPRVLNELDDIAVERETLKGKLGTSTTWAGFRATLKEAFTVKANLRRVQQALICYALAQLSGANSVTAYFVPILKFTGASDGDTGHSLFLSGMYSFAKFWYTLMASFFFIDALGRRRSLFVGVTIQMISDLYIGIFIKYRQAGEVAPGSGEAAIAFIFLHGFGYAVGLLVLPYVFGAEVWSNHLRSFGSALAQTFHWLFFFGVNKGIPSLLTRSNNWGAFIFFAGWCFLSLIYVFLMVPDTTGQSLEKLDELFEGPWLLAWRTENEENRPVAVLEGSEPIDRSRETNQDAKHGVKLRMAEV